MQDFIRIALGYGKENEKPELNNAAELLALSGMHDIAHIVGRGMELSTGFPEGEVGERLKKEMFKAVYRYELIRAELESIRSVFEAEKICFMPLKGAVIRELYPEPWLRSSCDIDILVHADVVENAAKILAEKLGYNVTGEQSHDLQIYSGNGKVHIELHYTLIEDYIFPDVDKVLEGVWDTASPVRDGAFEYKMSDEMFYFYHLAHAAKHLKHGGCGVRPFIDLFLMNKSGRYYGAKCEELLKKGGLYRFSIAASALADKWFGNVSTDDETVKLLEGYTLGGGVYGTKENNIAVQRSRECGRFGYFLKRVFIPYDSMKYIYPSVKNRRYLMPIYEVKRWFGIIFSGRGKKAMNEFKMNREMSKEKMDTVGDMLERLGI